MAPRNGGLPMGCRAYRREKRPIDELLTWFVGKHFEDDLKTSAKFL